MLMMLLPRLKLLNRMYKGAYINMGKYLVLNRKEEFDIRIPLDFKKYLNKGLFLKRKCGTIKKLTIKI